MRHLFIIACFVLSSITFADIPSPPIGTSFTQEVKIDNLSSKESILYWDNATPDAKGDLSPGNGTALVPLRFFGLFDTAPTQSFKHTITIASKESGNIICTLKVILTLSTTDPIKNSFTTDTDISRCEAVSDTDTSDEPNHDIRGLVYRSRIIVHPTP